MNVIKRYIAYLRRNPRRYWFRRKLFGWGWTPATWEGWLTLGVFVALIALDFVRLDAGSHSSSDTLRPFIFDLIPLAALLILVCYLTGEPPRWQWGFPKEEE